MYPGDFPERHKRYIISKFVVYKHLAKVLSSGSHNKSQKFQFQWDKDFTTTLLLIETSSSLRNTRWIFMLRIPDGFKASLIFICDLEE